MGEPRNTSKTRAMPVAAHPELDSEQNESCPCASSLHASAPRVEVQAGLGAQLSPVCWPKWITSNLPLASVFLSVQWMEPSSHLRLTGAQLLPCLITKWIKSLDHLIQVTLSCAQIVSVRSSLCWPLPSLPTVPSQPPNRMSCEGKNRR